MKRLFAVRLSRGEQWNHSLPLEGQPDWQSHAAFMDALVSEGFVVLGGPLEEISKVLLVIRSNDADEIRMRLAEDVWHRSGLLHILEITPWTLRLGSLGATAAAEDDRTDRVDERFGKPNPNAPAELSRFAFLIGLWQCEAKVRLAKGEWQTFHATWQGRFILDGYAVADEYRMTNSSGELIVLGINLRTYDAATQIWNMKWLNALAGKWVDLGTEEFGGVSFDGQSIIYAFKEPVASHAYTRATYTNISPMHFTWRGEMSDDGKAWREFIVVEAYRSEE